MVRVAPINLQYNPRTLWFDPGKLDVRKNDPVVVLTARGVEFGRAAGDVFEVEKSELKKLRCALKPVKRIATKADEEKAREMERKSREALPVFKKMVAEENADMRPVSVEYLLEGNRAVFFFESEERVDFRDLVRKLAAHFHVRIDMRQIGVRDEARMVGGFGHCGQELCCRRMGGGFCPVSIRMAKEQDLSLNPQKISGVCGRLMCCLRYEFDAYKDFNGRAPKRNGTVQTPDGPAKVVDLDVPREIVSLRVEGEKAVKVPLADIETTGGASRPNFVGEEAWERASLQVIMPLSGSSTYATSLFTKSDKLAQAGSVRHTGGGKSKRGAGAGVGSGGAGKGSKSEAKGASSRKPRRRRSTNLGGTGDLQGEAEGRQRQQRQQRKQKQQSQQQREQGQQKQNASKKKQSGKKGGQAKNVQAKGGSSSVKQGPRPGQKSSGLRQKQALNHDLGAGSSRTQRRSVTIGGSGASSSTNANAEVGEHRRARRRSHKAGGSAGTSGAGAPSVPGGRGGE